MYNTYIVYETKWTRAHTKVQYVCLPSVVYIHSLVCTHRLPAHTLVPCTIFPEYTLVFVEFFRLSPSSLLRLYVYRCGCIIRITMVRICEHAFSLLRSLRWNGYRFILYSSNVHAAPLSWLELCIPLGPLYTRTFLSSTA